MQKAIKRGRITVTKGKIDPKTADREWADNSDPVKVRHTNGNGAHSQTNETLARAQTKRAIFKAHVAEVEYQERIGKLIDADEVASAWQQIVTEFRSSVLAIPVKLRSLAPHMAADDLKMIEELLREALGDLAMKGQRERQRAEDTREP